MNDASPLSLVDGEISRAEHLNAVGADFFRRGQLEPARLHFLAALSLEPKNAAALQNLGAVLRNMRHYAASEIAAYRSVLVTNGKNPYCRSNLGVAQLAQRKFNAAIQTLKGVTVDLPESAPSWHNYGLACYMVGDYLEALAAFDRSLSIGYSDNALSDRALALLSLGKIQEGLADYEVRWNLIYKSKVWDFDVPEWKGESLTGKHILVHHEQGFGDGIMLLRFVSDLKLAQCQVSIAVPQSLKRLAERMFPTLRVLDIDALNESDMKGLDYHSPTLSVMRWLGIKEPKEISATPYIFAKPNFSMRLPETAVKIGICWASGNHGAALVDRRRLVPITSFLPLLRNVDVSLISLQKGEDVKDISAHGLEGLVFDVSPRLDDFADTANVIACLDLVISVDSAVAHLAGAMGKPCIMLSPYTRCWRWWGKGTGWPWYNRMKIFSQAPNGTWNAAIAKAIENVPMMLRS